MIRLRNCSSHLYPSFVRKYKQQTVLFSTNHQPMFDKVLIANRGEIACRIMKTCSRLGIKTVGVYSTADSRAKHVRQADEAICLGPPTSLESYLNIDKVCMAIEQSGAQAVAPGYGFLSENAEFARRVRDMNISFIGPSPEAIEKMGDKITSKQIAIDAGIETIPGFQGFIENEDHAIEVAKDVGFPVMIKATSGGGGKGMRICYSEDDVREGFILSTSEAIQSFGDGRLFIERFIENPHHIEFQIVAATDENSVTRDVLVFPERECSIQRRNQKILEESPSLLLNKVTRKEMSRQAQSLAKAVGYESAGTIEFLVEGNTVADDELQNFYFLEMNTRLQVEHPVTEMVTSIDLVEQMIRIAAHKYFDCRTKNGSIIPMKYLESQNNNVDEGVVKYKGWALEARLYAEDPLRNFLPSTGSLLKYEEPNSKDVSKMMDIEKDKVIVRVDSGVDAGSNISMFYDPMISKLVTYSNSIESSVKSRTAAIDAMYNALQRYVIVGPQHNGAFLSHVLGSSDNHSASIAFRAGDTPTNFIDIHYPDGFKVDDLPFFNSINDNSKISDDAATLAIYTLLHYMLNNDLNNFNNLSSNGSFIVVLGGFFGKSFEVNVGNSTKDEIIVKSLDNENALPYEAIVSDLNFGTASKTAISDFVINGKRCAIQLYNIENDGSIQIQWNGAVIEAVVRSHKEHELSSFMKKPPSSDTSQFLLSSMPGKLVLLMVNEGDKVEIGQELCAIEAMKMQNIIRSSRKGVIKKIRVSLEQSVKADEVLMEFED